MLAVDVGATHVRSAVVSIAADSFDVRRRDLAAFSRESASASLDAFVDWMHEGIDAAPHPASVAALSLGVAAAVTSSGELAGPVEDVIPAGPALIRRLSAEFQRPVLVENDANLAALGEAVSGAARGMANFALITLGTNIGMGIVHGGRILTGASGAAGELGQSILATPDSAMRDYPRLEDLFGGRALSLEMSRSTGAPLAANQRAPRVFRKAAGGDPGAFAIVQRALDAWAVAIANVRYVLDPEAVLLGGGMVDDVLPFLDELSARVVDLTGPGLRLIGATLGDRAALVGAANHARNRGLTPGG